MAVPSQDAAPARRRQAPETGPARRRPRRRRSTPASRWRPSRSRVAAAIASALAVHRLANAGSVRSRRDTSSCVPSQPATSAACPSGSAARGPSPERPRRGRPRGAAGRASPVPGRCGPRWRPSRRRRPRRRPGTATPCRGSGGRSRPGTARSPPPAAGRWRPRSRSRAKQARAPARISWRRASSWCWLTRGTSRSCQVARTMQSVRTACYPRVSAPDQQRLRAAPDPAPLVVELGLGQADPAAVQSGAGIDADPLAGRWSMQVQRLSRC